MLTKQCDFGPRVPGSKQHKECRDYLLEELKKSCDNARLQPFSHVWSKTRQSVNMWNIIAEQNWEKAEIKVCLFAHWDTRPSADQELDEANQLKPIPGANDGASGVAVLVELARALKGKLPANVGVQYVLVDGEDLGPGLDEMFLGADYYAKQMTKGSANYGILLDMIGDKDLHVPKEPNSMRMAPTLVKELYLHAARVNLRDAFPSVIGPEILDDHLPLNEAGLPTIDLIDFDYAPWHTLGDTPDKCSAASLGKVGKLLETWLLREKPFNISKDDSR